MPDLAEVFKVLRDMVSRDVIASYAVGGAVAAIFYTEPRETFDLDIFFILSTEPYNPLARLDAIYRYAAEKGFGSEDEFIRIHGWAVQFLEASSPLWNAAVSDSKSLNFEGVETRVIGPEYLAAMMVETGRSKDWIRLADFFEADVVNVSMFAEILERFGLADVWNKQKWRISGTA